MSDCAYSEERQFARLDGGLNYEMAISDWKSSGPRFGGRLVGSFEKGTYSGTFTVTYSLSLHSSNLN